MEEKAASDPGLAKPTPVGGLRGVLYVIVGLGFVALAILGVVLPVLPTTPFLLLASFFFVRSSPRLHSWLLHSRVFGGFLRDWQRHRAVRPRVKVTAVVVMLAAVSASLILADLPPVAVVLLLVLAAIGLTVVLRLPVLREKPPGVPAPTEESVSV